MSSAIIAGIRVDDITSAETVDRVEQFISEGGSHLMVVTNASKTVLAQRDETLRAIMRQADLVTADGMSVVWASRFLGRPLRERVTGIDTLYALVERAASSGYRVYFLGAKQMVVEEAIRVLEALHPGLIVAGYHDGYFDQNDEAMALEIATARPDILFVALGSPAQEKWIAKYQGITGAKFCLGVGGAFDHVAGFARRAPEAWQRAGFEWLFRLLSEPRRLWKRYLVGNTKFLWLVLKQRARGSET